MISAFPRSNLASRQRAAMTKTPNRKVGVAPKATTATPTTGLIKKGEGHKRQQPTNGRAVTAGKSGKTTSNGASGLPATSDSAAKEEETKENEQPREEEKKFEPSTHMEADLVETLGNFTLAANISKKD